MTGDASIRHHFRELSTMDVGMTCRAGYHLRPDELPGGWGVYFVSEMAFGARHGEVRPFEGERCLLMVGNRVSCGGEALDVVATLAFVSACHFVELAGVRVRVAICALFKFRDVESEPAAYIALLGILLVTLGTFYLGMFAKKWKSCLRMIERSARYLEESLGRVT